MDNSMQDSAVNNSISVDHPDSAAVPRTEAVKVSRELLDFIRRSPTPYHVASGFAKMLEKAGFEHLKEGQPWHLQRGGSYYVIRGGSSLIAFRIPDAAPARFQITAAHSDSPAFRLKTNPDIPCAGHYICLNVEKYGGAILSSWLDRPLSIAGRVMVQEADGIRERLLNFDRDLVLIPNVAIHMNRQINDGYAYHVQKDMLPLFGDETSAGRLQELIACELSVRPEQILSSDLLLYNRTPGTVWGAQEEYISSPKLDDLQCAYSAIRALIGSGSDSGSSVGSNVGSSIGSSVGSSVGSASFRTDSICGAAVFDNEEVGSRTARGADSTFLEDTLQRIWLLTGSGASSPEESYRMAVSGSFLISADNAHAVHPHHPDKADPVHRPLLNKGPVIKFCASQKYTTDAFSAAVFQTVCSRAGVPWQVFHNHSDQAGGSTLGNISNAHVSLHAADIGLAQLSMHSPYETAGILDTAFLIRALEEYYRTAIRIESDRVSFLP